MIPDVQVALERARMTAEINNLTSKGNALLLKSVSATAPVEAKSLHEEAIAYLNKADAVRDNFVARFPNSLNLRGAGLEL